MHACGGMGMWSASEGGQLKTQFITFYRDIPNIDKYSI
jgi:hypothetical protein